MPRRFALFPLCIARCPFNCEAVTGRGQCLAGPLVSAHIPDSVSQKAHVYVYLEAGGGHSEGRKPKRPKDGSPRLGLVVMATQEQPSEHRSDALGSLGQRWPNVDNDFAKTQRRSLSESLPHWVSPSGGEGEEPTVPIPVSCWRRSQCLSEAADKHLLDVQISSGRTHSL